MAGQVVLPGTSSVSVIFSNPSACDVCHGLFDREHSAYGTWAGSAMAHAGRDPIFRSAVILAESDAPGIGDLCLRCHVPAAWLEGRCIPTDGSALRGEDFGVSCAFCHRTLPDPYQRNGQFIVADDLTMRGPYPTIARARHDTEQSAWISDSRHCGSCHDLINPLVERKTLTGTPTGMLFPEQTTYLEWEASAFATEDVSCQDCHMPEDEGPIERGSDSRPDRSSHALAGGNVYLLRMIEFLDGNLNLGAELNRGIARNRAILGEAASMEISAPPTVNAKQAFTIDVRVINESGHKLPTGYPEGRRVFMRVQSEALGLDLGRYEESTGEVIDAPVVYESVQGQAASGPGPHLALNDTIFFDNRIPPRGFVPTATTAPVGYVFEEASPGVLAHWDDVTITATAPCAASATEVTGTIQLLHQSTTVKYLETLVDAARGTPPGDRLQAAVNALHPTPTEMLTQTFTVQVAADPSCPAVDAGPTDTGSTDAAPPEDAGLLDASDGGSTPTDSGGVEAPGDGGCNCRASGTRLEPAGGPRESSIAIVVCVFSWLWLRRRR